MGGPDLPLPQDDSDLLAGTIVIAVDDDLAPRLQYDDLIQVPFASGGLGFGLLSGLLIGVSVGVRGTGSVRVGVRLGPHPLRASSRSQTDGDLSPIKCSSHLASTRSFNRSGDYFVPKWYLTLPDPNNVAASFW